MKIVEGRGFQITYRFPGVLRTLPSASTTDLDKLEVLLRADVLEETPELKDTYWDGKWMGSEVTAGTIAEIHGFASWARSFHWSAEQRLSSWFKRPSARGPLDPPRYFWYDELWGTLIGFPTSYGASEELNDHHLHYGYFIRAAAEVVHRTQREGEDEWLKEWGPMVELLIRDIASGRRDDPLFPFLRNFDPYAGHSWASGHARFGDGNNQESSSEAMNAWYGMILWGEWTGNQEIRDRGIYLYTSEMIAIQEYWFDVEETNHPATYEPPVMTMIWGGKGAHETWFSANPEVVYGINWLPLHGGSLYLGHYPKSVARNYEALVRENKAERWDAWADLVWMYRGFVDPEGSLQEFNALLEAEPAEGAKPATDIPPEVGTKIPWEAGNGRANTYHWLQALAHFGSVQRTVWSDHVLSTVFEQEGLRTYVAYHIGEPRLVTFSDGFRLSSTGEGWAVAQRLQDADSGGKRADNGGKRTDKGAKRTGKRGLEGKP